MNLEELKKVVEKATPGPWGNHDFQEDQGEDTWTVAAERKEVIRDGQSPIWPNGIALTEIASTEYSPEPIHDAKFIATFNPSLVSKLLRVVEACYEEEKSRTIEEQVIACRHIKEALRDLEQS
jgi:hypothetical protein